MRTHSIAVFTLVALAGPALATTWPAPSFFGQAGTTFQQWESLGNPAASAPTAFTNPAGAANWFDRTASTDGVFLTGGHVYSFGGVVNPQIDVPTPTPALPGLTRLVLQTTVAGNPLDVATFIATPLAGGPSYVPTGVDVVSAGSGMFGTFTYVADWSNLPAGTGYSITYTPNATSSSQYGARVDTLTAVPEPAGVAGLGFAGAVLLKRRRRD